MFPIIWDEVGWHRRMWPTPHVHFVHKTVYFSYSIRYNIHIWNWILTVYFVFIHAFARVCVCINVCKCLLQSYANYLSWDTALCSFLSFPSPFLYFFWVQTFCSALKVIPIYKYFKLSYFSCRMTRYAKSWRISTRWWRSIGVCQLTPLPWIGNCRL